MPPTLTHSVSSPRATVEGLITVFECSREAFGGRTAINLPGLNVSVQHMLDALEAVAGPQVRARVRFQPDEAIIGIVSRWAKATTAQRANALGLVAEPHFEDIIRQYIADAQAGPHAAEALKGMAAP